MFPLPDSHSASSKSQTKSQGEGTTMTTHNNTPKDQYHRAPLNGLIIGTIVGTVCAAVFLLASEGTEFNLAILAVALGLVLSFSLLGWIDGLCERSIISHRPLSAQQRDIKMLHAVTTTLIGVIPAIAFYSISTDRNPMSVPRNAAFSWKALVLYVLPLIPFPLAGWTLGVIRVSNDSRRVIPTMTLMVLVLLSLCVGFWLFFSLYLHMLFFFAP